MALSAKQTKQLQQHFHQHLLIAVATKPPPCRLHVWICCCCKSGKDDDFKIGWATQRSQLWLHVGNNDGDDFNEN